MNEKKFVDGFAVVPNWIMADQSLTAFEKLAYICLMGFTDDKGYCYPSHSLVAERMQVSKRTVARALKGLRERGLVEWVNRADKTGGQTSNYYRVITQFLPGFEPSVVVDSESRTPRRRVPPPSTVSPTPLDGGADELNPIELNPINKTQLTSITNPTNNSNHTITNAPHIISPAEKKTSFDEKFSKFWETYPRRAGKRQAKAALAKTLSAGVSFEEILAGVERYRDDPNRIDQYTKHPTTWLNQGCWDDDPLPARTSPAIRASGNDIFVDIINDITSGGVLNVDAGNRNSLPWNDSR